MSETEQESIFLAWIKDHKGLLYKIVRAYAFTLEDRNDLFQDVSLQVWRSVPNFKGESAVTTWLYRIALNTALKWKGRESKYTNIIQPIGEYSPALHEDGTINERVDWLYSQISKLNEVDRSLCLMVLDDFTHKEMADIIGISENNVAVKIHRIKKYLSEQSKVS